MVSNWLHDNVKAGDILQVTPPFGDFTPDTESDEPIVLLSAGVGITPMISALNRIADVNPGRKVIFAHEGSDPMAHVQQTLQAVQAWKARQKP